MSAQNLRAELRVRQDGFGTRQIDHHQRFGTVEILDVTPMLATDAAEEGIKARTAHITELGAGIVSPVHTIHRDPAGLHIIAGTIDGVPVSAVIDALEAGTLMLADEALFDVIASVVRAVAALHALPARLAHGALTPSHVVLTRRGRAVLTNCGFATTLEALQRNREQYWREFGLALPPAASLPQFDQRADVAQLGAMALALALRRQLRSDEYPSRIADLTTAATPTMKGRISPLRMWLQQALQLHPRANFECAREAERALLDAITTSLGRAPSPQPIQTMVRLMCGDPASDGSAVHVEKVRSVPSPSRDFDPPVTSLGAGDSEPAGAFALLRAVLPRFRTT